MLKNFKGITLIALVVTIVIMLILSGISIATLTGNNGLITQANKAKEETENAPREEQLNMAILEANMNEQETEFNGVKVPKWCAPTRITGENNVNEGLVIVDKNGNEYVWIQVPNDGTGPIYPDDIGDSGVYTQTDLQNIEEAFSNKKLKNIEYK